MLEDVFERDKPIIGMVHLAPMPGTYHYTGKTVEQYVEEALEDAMILQEAGFDAIMIQNTHDVPTAAKVGPEVVAYMSAIGTELRRHVSIPIGVNIHKNDPESTLAVASVLNASFVRLKVYVGEVMDAEGITRGCAARALAYKQYLHLHNLNIWADIYDITSWPLTSQPIGEMAHWALKFGGADGLVITGRVFSETLDRVRQVKERRPDADVIIGGGIKHHNVQEALRLADAVIVGSALEEKPFTRPISSQKANEFIQIARS